jgi:hypothetical protein
MDAFPILMDDRRRRMEMFSTPSTLKEWVLFFWEMMRASRKLPESEKKTARPS